MLNDNIIKKLEYILIKYNNLNDEVSKNFTDFNKTKIIMKEISKFEQIVEKYLKYKKINKNLLVAKLGLKTEKDLEFIDILNEEIKENEIKLEKLTNEIKILLIPKNANDSKNVIVEIRGAVGGEEANIFASDIYKMYIKYAEQQHWKVELLECQETSSGGFSFVSFLLKGKNVYSKMKFEAGGHRVQRIPKTEVRGRVHTSIATVAIIKEAKEIDLKINPQDLRIDTYRSSGAGGQHVNVTDSAVRITHLPTGIVSTSQDGRSQHDNKDKALIALRSKLLDNIQNKQKNEISSIRKEAIGSGDRSEKIRTYNYPQNRVTDHRINFTLQKLDQIIAGNLDELLFALISNEQKKFLEYFND